jgi:hypothetical protein
MKLKFNFDGIVDGVLVYQKGKIYDIPTENNSAMRWVTRGAEQVGEEEEVSNPEPKAYIDPEVAAHGVSDPKTHRQKRKVEEVIKEEIKPEIKAVDIEDVALDALSGDSELTEVKEEVVIEEVKKENKEEKKKPKK